jgi:hypothetical protein
VHSRDADLSPSLQADNGIAYGGFHTHIWFPVQRALPYRGRVDVPDPAAATYLSGGWLPLVGDREVLACRPRCNKLRTAAGWAYGGGIANHLKEARSSLVSMICRRSTRRSPMGLRL